MIVKNHSKAMNNESSELGSVDTLSSATTITPATIQIKSNMLYSFPAGVSDSNTISYNFDRRPDTVDLAGFDLEAMIRFTRYQKPGNLSRV